MLVWLNAGMKTLGVLLVVVSFILIMVDAVAIPATIAVYVFDGSPRIQVPVDQAKTQTHAVMVSPGGS